VRSRTNAAGTVASDAWRVRQNSPGDSLFGRGRRVDWGGRERRNATRNPWRLRRKFQRSADVGMIGINVPLPVAYYSFGGWRASLFGAHPRTWHRRTLAIHHMGTLRAAYPRASRRSADPRTPPGAAHQHRLRHLRFRHVLDVPDAAPAAAAAPADRIRAWPVDARRGARDGAVRLYHDGRSPRIGEDLCDVGT
jgi:hypothetical protein